MVHPQIRDEVPDGHVGPAESVAEVGENTESNGKTNVGKHNVLGVLLIKDGGAGVKVVDAAAEAVLPAFATALTLALMEVVASNIGEEVVGPSDKLLGNKVQQSVDGGLFAKLAELVNHSSNTGGLLLTGSRQEDHVALHVASGLVVCTVGKLPAEVGYEKR